MNVILIFIQDSETRTNPRLKILHDENKRENIYCVHLVGSATFAFCFGFELPLFPTELPVLKDENSESISVIVLKTKKYRDGQK